LQNAITPEGIFTADEIIASLEVIFKVGKMDFGFKAFAAANNNFDIIG